MGRKGNLLRCVRSLHSGSRGFPRGVYPFLPGVVGFFALLLFEVSRWIRSGPHFRHGPSMTNPVGRRGEVTLCSVLSLASSSSPPYCTYLRFCFSSLVLHSNGSPLSLYLIPFCRRRFAYQSRPLFKTYYRRLQVTPSSPTTATSIQTLYRRYYSAISMQRLSPIQRPGAGGLHTSPAGAAVPHPRTGDMWGFPPTPFRDERIKVNSEHQRRRTRPFNLVATRVLLTVEDARPERRRL